MVTEPQQRLQAAVTAQLASLERLLHISRQMHPPLLPELIAGIGDVEEPVRQSAGVLQDFVWPENLKSAGAQIKLTGELILQAFDHLRQAAGDPNGLMQAYYALRHATRAQEALYPLSAMIPEVSRFFLNDDARDDAALLARLEAGAGRDNTGVMHSVSTPLRQGSGGQGSGDNRGGFSLYVPESYDAAKAYPLIFSLHGGSGNGRAHLWSWMRAARSHEAILVSPTARGQTWALQGQDIDTPNLLSMLSYVRERWNIDEAHLLMTGMSDGGTFTYLSGLQAVPFTHLAPIAASFHPMLLEFFEAERIKDLPIHITHGRLDWMFPAISARNMALSLTQMDANVVYREIADLSHTYPDANENAEVMQWFLGEG